MSTIAVLGAGVAGLSVAFELVERTHRHTVHVYEASATPGGNIHTDIVEGFTVEWGPNGFLDNVPETLDLVDRLGISDRLLPASEDSKHRFIWRDGRLHEIKANPIAFLASSVLSWPGKVRLIAEPLTDTRPDGDESVFDFASRHIGAEAARVLVDAMVSGVFAGDAGALSLKSAFPKMHEMESRYGSLVRAMLARLREHTGPRQSGGPAGPAGNLTSFKGGMADLIAALVRRLGPDRISLRTAAESVEQVGLKGFRLHFREGRTEEADAVVLAVPAWDAAPVVKGVAPDMAAALEEIPGAPLAVIATGFKRDEIGRPVNGFGFLVPRDEGLRILGSLWSSSIFPGRAPDGTVLLQTMIGGAHSPQLASRPDDELHRIVLDDLRTAMGITAQTTFRRIYRHIHGIPQYTLGHERRLNRIYAGARRFPGLYVTGNSYVGIAVNACIKAARALAEQVIDETA